jgi:hypothetical protein
LAIVCCPVHHGKALLSDAFDNLHEAPLSPP